MLCRRQAAVPAPCASYRNYPVTPERPIGSWKTRRGCGGSFYTPTARWRQAPPLDGTTEPRRLLPVALHHLPLVACGVKPIMMQSCNACDPANGVQMRFWRLFCSCLLDLCCLGGF